MNKWIKNLGKVSIGIIILSFLLYRVGFQEISELLKNINPLYIIIILIIYPFLWLINALKVTILLKPIKKGFSVWRIFPISILTYSIINFTPGHLGEGIMVYFLKKNDIDYGEGLAIMVSDKMISLIVNLLFAIGGFILILEKVLAIKMIILFTILFTISIFTLFSKFTRNLIKKYILRKYAGTFKGFSNILNNYIKYHKKYIFLNIITSITKVATISLIIFIGFTALDQNNIPSWGLIMLINSTISIISMIPITFAGLGVRETSAVFFYASVGIPAAIVTSAYLIFLTLRYLLSITIILIWSLMDTQFTMKDIKLPSFKP